MHLVMQEKPPSYMVVYTIDVGLGVIRKLICTYLFHQALKVYENSTIQWTLVAGLYI